jgi:hypothetical protein
VRWTVPAAAHSIALSGSSPITPPGSCAASSDCSRSSRANCSVLGKQASFFQLGQLRCQPANLGVQLGYLLLMCCYRLDGFIILAEQVGQPFQSRRFPAFQLIGMDAAFSRQLIAGFRLFQDFLPYLGFELSGISFTHSRYCTLNSGLCPVQFLPSIRAMTVKTRERPTKHSDAAPCKPTGPPTPSSLRSSGAS